MGGEEGSGEPEERAVEDVLIDSSMDEGTEEPQKQSIEEFDANLPDTVTLLRGSHGSKLYLVGTGHFSNESKNDVSKVIQTVKPNVVVVELCKSRANILKMDEKTIEEEVRNLSYDKMVTIIKENGVLQGVMNILLLNLSAQLTRDLGMAPGGEFRRAYTESLKVRRRLPCAFFLGDRSLQVTIKRALAVLSWWQRVRLAWTLVVQKPKVSLEDVENFKQNDLLEAMLNDMAAEFPELGKVFIEERDTYLTYSLQVATESRFGNADYSDEPTVAVGVVGIGHTPGIKALWGTVREADIIPIMTIQEPVKKGYVRKLLVVTVLAYFGVKVIKRLPISSIYSNLCSHLHFPLKS